jgi:NADPH-ferrihemoprotein reductase
MYKGDAFLSLDRSVLILHHDNVYRPYDQKNPYMAPISVNRELHKGGDRSCMHIELDITESKLR